MAYLRQRDYDRIILDAELNQITDTDTGLVTLAEYTSRAEVYKWLKQKYYLDWEFTDTNIYSQSVVYTGNNRVELNFPAYDDTKTYAIGDLVSNIDSNEVNQQYVCKIAITIAAPFDPTKFTNIGVQYDLYYLQLPYPLFQLIKGFYKPGDIVFWKGNLYICQKGTQQLDRNNRIQAVYDQDIPYPNIFPDDPQNGVSFWGNPMPYIIAGLVPNIPVSTYTAWSSLTTYTQGSKVSFTINGTPTLFISQKTQINIIPETDITAWIPYTWTFGDNRDQLVVKAMVNFSVFNLYPRTTVDAEPTAREINRNQSIAELKGLALGDFNEDKLVIIENQIGINTQFGGAVKNVNLWVIVALCVFEILIKCN